MVRRSSEPRFPAENSDISDEMARISIFGLRVCDWKLSGGISYFPE